MYNDKADSTVPSLPKKRKFDDDEEEEISQKIPKTEPIDQEAGEHRSTCSQFRWLIQILV